LEHKQILEEEKSLQNQFSSFSKCEIYSKPFLLREEFSIIFQQSLAICILFLTGKQKHEQSILIKSDIRLFGKITQSDMSRFLHSFHKRMKQSSCFSFQFLDAKKVEEHNEKLISCLSIFLTKKYQRQQKTKGKMC
jgi:hypothetical protein